MFLVPKNCQTRCLQMPPGAVVSRKGMKPQLVHGADHLGNVGVSAWSIAEHMVMAFHQHTIKAETTLNTVSRCIKNQHDDTGICPKMRCSPIFWPLQ